MYFRFLAESSLSRIFVWLTLTMTLSSVDYNCSASSVRARSDHRMLHRRSVRKSANVGGNRVLECDVNYPGGAYVRRIITWRKQGLEAPIFSVYDGYPPRMDASYHGRIRLMQQASIEIINITTADEGWYECSVLFLDKNDDTNINGTWTHLSVNSSPVLGKVSPSLMMPRDGETVELYCEASGSPTPTLTWFKDGQEMRPSERVSFLGGRVRVKSVNKMDAGLYVCSFKNIVGTISHLIKLVIQGNGWNSSGNVYITVQPKNTTVIEGSRVKLQCHAEGSPDNITYHWNHNGVDFHLRPSLASKGQILSDGTLIINSVSKDDSGWYKCRPTNKLGVPPEARAYLNVTYFPKVLSMPSRLYLPQGLMGRVDCPVESNPPLTVIVWRKDNVAIDYTQLRHIKANKDGTLIIKPVIFTDEGHYTCVPFSPLGQGQPSLPVHVLVRDPPYFTYRPKLIYQRQPTQSVTMPCIAQGDPPPVISWRKAEGILPTPTKILYSGGNLTIVNLGKEDHGIYECVASNVVSSVVTTTFLIIELTTPHPPYNVTVETGHESAQISWLPAYDEGFPQHYVIWYRARGVSPALSSYSASSRGQWTTLRVLSSNITSVTVHLLMPDVLYEFMVLSRNRIGDGLFSDVTSARTKAYAGHRPLQPFTQPPKLPSTYSGEQRPERPFNLTVKQTRQGLLISWIGPRDDHRSAAMHSPLSYIIEYRTVGQWVPLVSRLTGTTSFNWTTASRGATYHFRVICYWGQSSGPDPDYNEDDLLKSLPSDVVTVHTGDPMNEGVRVSDEMIGGAIGGLFVLLMLLAVCVFAVRSFRRWRRRRKALKGQALATSDPDPEPFTENHLDLDTMVSTKINAVKETPI